jgi:catechol 2,3-dioxygenase-like lactoylglutathione lyase family enzyme
MEDTLDIAKQAVDVGIVVPDATVALTFYCDKLGLQKIGENPIPGGGTLHRLACGDSTIKIIEYQKGRDAATLTGDVSETGLRYLTITVGDLDPIAEMCASGNTQILSGPLERYPGVRIMFVSDPDGNRIEFREERHS